ncbi:NUDIX domain-containing protein [Actinomycetospora sp. C-140]
MVFNDHGEVLLVRRRDNGQWQAPGGVLELNETFEEGVAREVLEETGVLVEPTHLTGIYKNMVRGVVALVYRCRPVCGEPATSDESIEVAWVDLHEAVSRMAPAFAIRVEDAARSLGTSVSSRAHDGTNLV